MPSHLNYYDIFISNTSAKTFQTYSIIYPGPVFSGGLEGFIENLTQSLQGT